MATTDRTALRNQIAVVLCGCGRRFSRAAWQLLQIVGHVDAETGELCGAAPGAIEMRNCSACRSTITRSL